MGFMGKRDEQERENGSKRQGCRDEWRLKGVYWGSEGDHAACAPGCYGRWGGAESLQVDAMRMVMVMVVMVGVMVLVEQHGVSNLLCGGSQ